MVKNSQTPKSPIKIELSPRMVVTIITMTVTLCMLVASATAWLTVNRVSNANGVEMAVSGTSNLVIAAQLGEMKTENYSTYKITFPANSGTYAPATHDYDDEYGSAVSLKYLTNPEQIDPATGMADQEAEDGPYFEEYEAVEEDINSSYYKDYSIYIASAGGELTNTDLLVTLTYDEDTVADSDLALSADFYWHGPDVNTFTFAGTLNLAGEDNRPYELGEGEEWEWIDFRELTLYTDTIPACTAGEISIIMRVYYDGALLDFDGNAYMRTSVINNHKFGFDVTFEAIEASEPEPWWPLEEE